MMISFENVALQLSGRLLFTGVDLQLNPKSRYAVVGANGAGKSTLLRLIASDEEPSEGRINIAKSMRIGWLQQDQHKYDQCTLMDAVMQGRPELWEALVEKEEILTNPELSMEDGMRLATLEEVIQNHDGYEAEGLAATLLKGLGFTDDKLYTKMSTLSGGYKIRVLLAKLLFSKPDVLLLDEPTNHLDITTTAWLEQFLLNEHKGILVFVSHDHEFCNNLATSVLDIDYGEVREYKGNLDRFNIEKAQVIEHKTSHRENLEAKIAKLQEFIDRLGAKASKARQAKSKAKQIDKIELPDIEKTSRRSPRINFEPNKPSGKVVLKADKICKSYGSKNVLKNISLRINKGDKVAIVGPNGIGKSTLLKIITSGLDMDAGVFEWGYGVDLAYFPQDIKGYMKDDIPVLQWLEDNTRGTPENMLRKELGNMLFDQDDVKKNVRVLSGGECTRLMIAKLKLQKPNVIVLDEPTNHLDMEAIQALASSLKSFAGTVILVSHDRRFVKEICRDVVELNLSLAR